jgi:hypothetical protein
MVRAGRSTSPHDYVLGNETFESKGGHVGETEIVRAPNLQTQLETMQHSAGLGIRLNSAFDVSCWPCTSCSCFLEEFAFILVFTFS